ncbi:uncharacterized protein METZ01_LOCUS420102, partial [marine metagenome]
VCQFWSSSLDPLIDSKERLRVQEAGRHQSAEKYYSAKVDNNRDEFERSIRCRLSGVGM